jgi:cytochrome c
MAADSIVIAFHRCSKEIVRMSAKYLLPMIVSVGVLAAGAASAADGDPAAGKKLFNQCMACHSLVKDKNGLGPSLHGVIGRKAATAEGFKNYSPAMQKAGIVWSEENIAKYLADPKGFIPGNRMIFQGLKKDEDRADLIAFLKQASKE